MSLEKLTVKTKQQLDFAIVKITGQIFAGVISKTPVGDPTYWYNYVPPPGYVGGRAKGNWQASKGTPIRSEIERIDGEGSSTIAEATLKIESGVVMYLSNNVPYIRELEYGYSKRQAPTGWVRATIQQYARKVSP
jgi:hypothetical protein